MDASAILFGPAATAAAGATGSGRRPFLTQGRLTTGAMSQGIHRRIRPDAVWAEVRKAWEDGETARSVAKRYDVGVHALWKRREAEGWKRPEPTLGPIEPAEG